MKKLGRNIIISFVLMVAIVGWTWVQQSKEEAFNFLEEFWWIFVGLPFFLVAYSWFTRMKSKAFDTGYAASDKLFTGKEKTNEAPIAKGEEEDGEGGGN